MSGPDRPLRLRDAGIRVDSMPPAGRELHLIVDDEERAAVAEALGITAVESLEVRLHAVKFRGGVRVTGRIEAVLVQPSVVSLEPVQQTLGEPVDRVFLPEPDKPRAGAAGAEIFVDLEGEDLPDHFEGPEADLSGLIVETLALGLDPYPRAEGETLQDLGLGTAEEEDESPFARLAALKKTGDND